MTSDGSNTPAPMPPKRRPSEPRKSSMPKCSRAGASMRTTRSATRNLTTRNLGRGDHGQLIFDVIGEERHRLVLARTGRFIDDDLQPSEIRADLGRRDEMGARGDDRGLEHRVAGAI